MILCRLQFLVRYGSFLMACSLMVACDKREPIEDYIAKATSSAGTAPESLAPLVPYRPLPYQASLQRNPFIPAENGFSVSPAISRVSSPLAADCDQDISAGLWTEVLSVLSLRATFTGGHHYGKKASALIQVAGAEALLVTVGQPFELELEQKIKKLNVSAITPQQVTLTQRLMHEQGCEHPQTASLQLY